MRKLKTFNELNELLGTTYKSVMDKVKDKSDPRSYRLYDDARKLRNEYYSKEPLKIRIANSEKDIDFKIYDIFFIGNDTLKISNDEDEVLFLDLIRLTSVKDWKIELRYHGDEFGPIKAFTNRKGANILSKILKDYDVEIKPQDIPQF